MCVMLGFCLQQCFNLPSWTNATNNSPIGSKKIQYNSWTQRWCPETPKNGAKKPLTPKSPKFVPKRRFHKRKSIRAVDLSKNRFFRVFALSGRKVAKIGIVVYFCVFFGGKTYNCGVFLDCGNHIPHGIDTVQLMGCANLKVLLKSTLFVDQHL